MRTSGSLTLAPLLLALLPAAAAGGETPAKIDYHAVRGRSPMDPPGGVFEGERHLRMTGGARAQGLANYGPHWSGGAHLLWDGAVGASLKTGFEIRRGSRYQLLMRLTKAPDYGRFRIKLNGQPIGPEVDLYSTKVEPAALLDLGRVDLKTGPQQLEFKLVGANARAVKFKGKGYLMGVDFIKLVDQTPPPDDRKQPPAVAGPIPRVSLSDAKALLTRFCFECHGGKKVEGEVRLSRLRSQQQFLDNITLTEKVADALERHEMPPEDAPQPSAIDRHKLSAFTRSLIDEYLRKSSTLAPVAMRRLNRYEYNNAVRDLLRLKGDIYPLPEKTIRSAQPYFDPPSGKFPDRMVVGNRTLGKFQVERPILKGVVPFAIDLQAEHGFNNRGDELSLSPILLESFIKLGQSIVTSPQFDGYCRIIDSFFHADRKLDSSAQAQLAGQRIPPFLERAFRAPIDDATAHRYTRFFERELARTGSFTASMKRVVAAVLASPRFLYLVERKGGSEQSEPLSDYELASRLSFFLWSSIPDEKLLELARAGRLHHRDALRGQVRRMLLDRRSQALSQSFARQWLRLDQLITATPDFERFPRYYSRIGCEQWKFGLQTMLEPLLLFENIMVEDRSIMLLVDSNYSYRSDELQSWYQQKTPFGGKANINRFNTFQQEFRRRRLSSRREGGVITTAATMTMTSSPLRTSPITRGAWVATVIFNKPPPPPPDEVPEIEADDAVIEAKGLTLRQRLKQHQVNPSCASCHSKIDPLGFALERFDAVGRWRDRYRSGLEIDASGALHGDLKFKDVAGFKDALLARPEHFTRAFSEHLLSYALGRQLKLSDKPAVDRIVRRVMADRGRFSSVVDGVVMSYPFLHKADSSKTERGKTNSE